MSRECPRVPNSTRPADGISLLSSVRSDVLRPSCQPLLISDLNSTSFAHHTSVRSEYSEPWHDRQPLVYGTCPGREIGHTTTPARLLLRTDSWNTAEGKNAKVLRRNTDIQGEGESHLSNPVQSSTIRAGHIKRKKSPCLGWAGLHLHLHQDGFDRHETTRCTTRLMAHLHPMEKHM